MASLDSHSYDALRQDVASLLENERSTKRQGIEQEKAQTYWKVGQRLNQVVPVQKGGTGYGRQILKQLSQDLDIREWLLYEMLQFYRALEIVPTSVILGWSHYRALLKVPDSEARTYYLKEAIEAGWSVRRLENQIRDRVFEQQQDPAQSALIPRRGKLYTYRLVPSFQRPRLDLGFGIFHAAPFPGAEKTEPGGIVEVVQTASHESALYRLQPRALGKSVLYTYPAVVERVVDGDTLWAEIDCGFHIWVRQKLRLRGIDTPELSLEEGQQVRERVAQTLSGTARIVLSTYRPDKYGRYLADLFYLEGSKSARRILRQGSFLNGELLEAGKAVRY